MLTFRGQSLQETEDPRTSRYFFDLVKGVPQLMPAQVRGEDVLAPGRPGLYLGNRVEERMNPLLEGFIRGFGATPQERAESWYDASQTILTVFQMDSSPGTLLVGPGSISYLGLPSDFEIEVRSLDVMEGPIESHMHKQEWSIELEAVDGFWWTEIESS